MSLLWDNSIDISDSDRIRYALRNLKKNKRIIVKFWKYLIESGDFYTISDVRLEKDYKDDYELENLLNNLDYMSSCGVYARFRIEYLLEVIGKSKAVEMIFDLY